MTKRISLLLAAGALSMMVSGAVFAQGAGTTTPGDAKTKMEPTGSAMDAQESPGMQKTGKTPVKNKTPVKKMSMKKHHGKMKKSM